MSIEHTLNRFANFAGRPRCLIGASLLRVIAGTTIVYQFLINHAQRRYLFGPDGVFPWEDFIHHASLSGQLSLYALSRSTWWFEFLYHAGIVVAFAWTCGWRTRLTTPLTWALWLSMHWRTPHLWDGGDNLMQIVLIYMIFADVGAHFTLCRRRGPAPARDLPHPSMVVHNAAMLALALQVSFVYLVAGLAKVSGESWPSGVALYYALRAPEFRLPGVSELIWQNAGVLVPLAYVTVAFQIAFPFFLFLNRFTRHLAVAVAVMFHLGIGMVMGLVTFASFLIAADLALVGDAEYRGLAAGARWLIHRVRDGRRGKQETLETADC